MKISLITFHPCLTGKWFIRDVRLDLCQPQHFNLQDDSWGGLRLGFPLLLSPHLCMRMPLIFHLVHMTLTHLPTSEEWICLYYHILNGSIMKGLLVIRQEGVGPVLTGQRMALRGLLGMLMSAGSSGSALNSSQFLLSFFFSFQALYCGCSCHGSRWFFSCMDGCLWAMCWFRYNWPLCIHRWHIDWQYSRLFI